MKSFSPTALAALAGVGLTFLVWGLLQIPYFAELESETGDEMVALRHRIDQQAHLHPTDPRIVVAAIDERTLHDFGNWPLPRFVHGQFLAALAPEKPRVVGWDVLFTEHSGVEETTNGEGSSLSKDDAGLVEGAGMFSRLVTGAKRGEGMSPPLTDDQTLLPTRPFKNVTGDIRRLSSSPDASLPFPELRKESYFGFVDELGRIRRIMPMVVNVNGHILPSFDCQVLMQYWGTDPDQVTVELGRAISFPQPGGPARKVPIDENGCFLLNYRGTLEDFHPMSYDQMGEGLTDKANGTASDSRNHLPAITDNIVIVGVTVVGTDAGVTPLDAASPLVVTHLNVLNNILQQDFLRSVSPLIWMPGYGLFLFGLGNTMLRVGISRMIPIAIGALLVVAVGAFAALFWGNTLTPVLAPELGILILGGAVPTRRFFGEEREKTRIKSAMRAYLSDKVMAKVLEHPDNLKLGGVKQEITIMFCDIRGFTAYCDERDPQETMDVLNEYMETMTQVVFEHDGTIDKYIGDCIMAFWNAPELQPDHAQKAVRCAMEMRGALAEFTAKRAGTELASFECGIGIHTGEALVGNMGSSLKRNYTAMGSTVNLASRLESLTKKLEERILISVDTFNQLQGDFPIVDRGEATVAGVGRPVHVYAVKSKAEFLALKADLGQRV
jgi:adenylate cyclase